MNYNKIRYLDISNGPGVRVSIFVQGCTFNCEGCFNPETHDFNQGKIFMNTDMEKIIELSNKEYIEGLSILGGEPLHPKNVESTTMIAEYYKYKYPEKTIWLWSGFKYEDIKDYKIMQYLDVLVDGQFDITKKNITLKYCGSSNQRVIDVQKSKKENKIILYKDK